MKTLLVLLFSLLFVGNIQDDSYSIYTFISYMQETGYYGFVQQVKYNLGVNVSTELCIELTDNNCCEEFVKVYIPPAPCPKPGGPPKKTLEELINSYRKTLLKNGLTESDLEYLLLKYN